MRNFLRRDRWDLDVLTGFVFATGVSVLLVGAAPQGTRESSAYGIVLLPLAAFIVTNELGATIRRRDRHLPGWLWMPLVSASVFVVMSTIVALPIWFANYHRIHPGVGIPDRLVRFATDVLPRMWIPFLMWAVPATIYSLVARFAMSLLGWIPGIRSTHMDLAQLTLGLTLFAATFFGSIWLITALH